MLFVMAFYGSDGDRGSDRKSLKFPATQGDSRLRQRLDSLGLTGLRPGIGDCSLGYCPLSVAYAYLENEWPWLKASSLWRNLLSNTFFSVFYAEGSSLALQ